VAGSGSSGVKTGDNMQSLKVKVIGLGGIGSYLVEPLARYLSFGQNEVTMTLIDGDKYEEKNRNRQQFGKFDNKAAVTADELTPKFPKIHFRSKKSYITDDNVIDLIREGDLVFLCVDNHATRKLVSDRCEELENVTLISGGNDYTDGNVIYYRRVNGKNVSESPTSLHDKIKNPTDVNPGTTAISSGEGCEAQVENNPQLLFMNLAIASCMCNVYYSHEQNKAKFNQVFVDIRTHSSRATPEPEIILE